MGSEILPARLVAAIRDPERNDPTDPGPHRGDPRPFGVSWWLHILLEQHAAFEQEADHEAHIFLDSNHPELEIVDVTVESDLQTTAFDELGIDSDEHSRMIVTVSGATSEELPDLADDIDRHITQATGHDVVVEVEFVDAQSSG